MVKGEKTKCRIQEPFGTESRWARALSVRNVSFPQMRARRETVRCLGPSVTALAPCGGSHRSGASQSLPTTKKSDPPSLRKRLGTNLGRDSSADGAGNLKRGPFRNLVGMVPPAGDHSTRHCCGAPPGDSSVPLAPPPPPPQAVLLERQLEPLYALLAEHARTDTPPSPGLPSFGGRVLFLCVTNTKSCFQLLPAKPEGNLPFRSVEGLVVLGLVWQVLHGLTPQADGVGA